MAGCRNSKPHSYDNAADDTQRPETICAACPICTTDPNPGGALDGTAASMRNPFPFPFVIRSCSQILSTATAQFFPPGKLYVHLRGGPRPQSTCSSRVLLYIRAVTSFFSLPAVDHPLAEMEGGGRCVALGSLGLGKCAGASTSPVLGSEASPGAAASQPPATVPRTSDGGGSTSGASASHASGDSQTDLDMGSGADDE